MKNVPLNDLSRMSEEEIDHLAMLARSVISSGTFLSGTHTREFVSKMSERVGGRRVVCVGNGTDALYVGMRVLNVGAQSRVATIPNGGGYATGAALRLGATPVMVDADPVTAQMSIDSLKEVLATRTIDVVVVTHLYGLATGVEEVAAVCAEHGVQMLEDCAQSFGCAAGSMPVGTFGDVATFSFYPTKNLGGFGDAGAVVLKSEEQAVKAQQIAQYGWSDRYVVVESGGFNSRMDELQAAFLNHRIEALDGENSRRREITMRYRDALPGRRTIIAAEGPEFVGHLAVMLTDVRQSDQQTLHNRGISTGIHYPVLDHHQPAWQQLIENPGTPNAEKLVTRILTLPCFPSMTEDEIERVVTALGSLE